MSYSVPRNDRAYDGAPRVVDTRLPGRIFYVSTRYGTSRPYTTAGHVKQKLKAMTVGALLSAKVYAHRTAPYHGLHGWLDVTPQFVRDDGTLL